MPKHNTPPTPPTEPLEDPTEQEPRPFASKGTLESGSPFAGTSAFWQEFYSRFWRDSPQDVIAQGPQPIFGEGYHPVWDTDQAVYQAQAILESRGKLGPLAPFGGLSGFVENQLGYLPTYWEDPKRIAKWYHKMDALPEGADPPDWIDRDRLNAAYTYLERANEGTPWWDWKYLHPTDPARSFLQGFTNPPPEAMYPEELLYTPGAIAEEPSAGPPLPGSPEWDKLDLWMKVMVSIFGAGPSILDPYDIDRGGILGAPLRSGLATFGRGFTKGAPTGAAIGFFTTGPMGVLGGGLITGMIGGLAEVGLETIHSYQQKGLGFEIGGVTDSSLEYLLNTALGLIQYPAEQIERTIGTGVQIQAALQDPNKYGPVADVFGNLNLLEFPGKKAQGLVSFLPYIGGPTGNIASLTYETATGAQRVITHGLEYLSTSISQLTGGDEELQLQKPDEVWDLGGTEPRKIGPNTPDTAAAVWKWALATGRHELMTTELSPRDAVLGIGARFGISGILSDLFLQALLDPLNFTPTAEVRIARGIARDSGVGGRLGAILKIGGDERAALNKAIQMIELKQGRVRDIRGVRSGLGYLRGQLQVGGKEVLATFANILRTDVNLGQVETIKGMGTFSRWLAGIDAEGVPRITLAERGVVGKFFGLTPKARATKFLFTSHDVVKLVLDMADSPDAVANTFEAMASGDAAQWQKMGLGILGTPDGQYPVLAARDFNVEILKGFLEVWRGGEQTRNILNTVQRLFGHESIRETVQQLRDFGDASWQKLNDAVRAGVAEGDEGAISVARAIDQRLLTKKTLDGALKSAYNGHTPLTLDHFRWIVYDAWLQHIGDWAVKSFNVEIEPMFYRLSNAVKQGASIVLLDGNPGYLYANFWNNTATTAIDGSMGFNSIARIVDYFENTLGMTPARLEQAFGGIAGTLGEAGLVSSDQLAKMSFAEAIEAGVSELEWVKAREAATFQKLSQKSMGQGAVKMLDRFLGSLRQKEGQTGPGKWSPLIMSRLSASVERLQGANAYYSGTKSWLNRAWRRVIGFDRLPEGIETALGPELVEKVYGMVEGNLRYDLIEKSLLGDGRIEANVNQFTELVSQAMGEQVSAADVLQMLTDTDILPVLEAELPGAKNVGDIHIIFSEIENQMRGHINQVHAMELITKAGEVGEAIKMGDLTGVHDTWVDLNARMAEWWTSHVLEWGNIVEEADLMVGEGFTDAADALYTARLETAKAEANRIMEMQTAVIDGLVEGLRESGVDVGPKYALGLRLQIAEWSKFFEIRDALWEGYGEARKEGTLETGRYTEIIEELGGRYDRMIEDDLDLQQVMDAEIVSATAAVNLRAATVLSSLLETIREHKAKIFTQEAAVRQGAHELWNLTTGTEAANVLMRNFAGHPELAKAFETLVKRWKGRTTEVTGKDLRSFRRQVYDIWSREVKVQHIKDYYLLRSEGMFEVMSEDANVRPPDVERPEPIRSTTESTGTEAEVARVVELVEGGTPPEQATRIGAEQIAGELMEVDYSKATTLEEIRLRASRDAGIATATKDGRPFDGHLLNVLNKDLGLNDTPSKLRRLEDLLDIRREGGQPTDAMDAARQAIVNRGAKRLQWSQESKLVNLSIESLETLDAGIDNVGTKKLRRIAEANGLTEANLMPKEHLWSWLDARRKRLRSTPFEAASPDAIKQQIKTAMDRTGYPGSEIATMTLADLEARAKAIGMTVGDYIEFRYGLDNPDIIYTFSQQEGRPESPWIQRAREIFDVRSDIKKVDVGFLLRDGDVLKMELDHLEIGRVWGASEKSMASIDKFMEAGPVRYRVHDGKIVSIEFKQLPTAVQRAKLSTLMDGRAAYIVDFRSLAGKEILSLTSEPFPTRGDIRDMWSQMTDAAEKQTTTLFQDADAHKPIYSQMARAVDAKMPDRMVGGDLINLLRKHGVKPEEMKWSLLQELVDIRGEDAFFEKSEVLALTQLLEPQFKHVLLPEQDVKIQPVSFETGDGSSEAPVTWNRTDILPGTVDAEGRTNFRQEWGWSDIVDHPNERLEYTIKYEGNVDHALTVISEADFADGIAAYEVTVEHVRYAGGFDSLDARDIINRPTFDRVGQPGFDLPREKQYKFRSIEEAKAAVENWRGYDLPGRDVGWERYTYPGGSNYRELILHFPEKTKIGETYAQNLVDAWNTADIGPKQVPGELGFTGISNLEPTATAGLADVGSIIGLLAVSPESWRTTNPELVRAWETYQAFNNVWAPRLDLGSGAEAPGFQDFKSHAFSEPNILSWVRMKDRLMADGRRVLFMEELQSDYGQGARKIRKGQRFFDVRKELADTRLELIDLNTEMQNLTNDAITDRTARLGAPQVEGDIVSNAEAARAYSIERWTDINDRISAANKKLGKAQVEQRKFKYSDLEEASLTSRTADPIPLPFEKTWDEYSLKQMIRLAAEEGYEGFMWNDADGVFQAETGTEFVEAQYDEARQIQWLQVPFEEEGHLTIWDGDGNEIENGVFSETEARHLVGDAWHDLETVERVNRYPDAGDTGTVRASETRWRELADTLGLFDRDYADQAWQDYLDQGGPESYRKYVFPTEVYGDVEVFSAYGTDDFILRPEPSDTGVKMTLEEVMAELDSYEVKLPDFEEVMGSDVEPTLVREDFSQFLRDDVGRDDPDFHMLGSEFYDAVLTDDPDFLVPTEIELFEGRADPEVGESQAMQMRQGFEGFYEKMLPNTANKILKPFKVKVERAEFAGMLHDNYSNVVEVNGQKYVIRPDTSSDGFKWGVYEWLGPAERTLIDQFRNFEQVIAWAGENNRSMLLDYVSKTPVRMHDGFFVPITDEMRAGNGPEFKLFQETNEYTLIDNELSARRALLEAIKQEELPTQPFYRMVEEGIDISQAWEGLDVLPEPVVDAYLAWLKALEAGQWADGQKNMTAAPKGAVAIGRDGRALMRFFNNADPSTVIHEVGHIFRLDLQPSELDVVTDWLRNTVRKHDGVDVTQVEMFEGRFVGDEGVPRAAEEAFARGYERWRAEGIAPNKGLQAVFEKFSKWLLEIYQQIRGTGIDIPLNESMRALFSDMLGGRAPDFDIYNTTWKSIETDSVIRGQPDPRVAAEAFTDADVDAMAERVYAEQRAVDPLIGNMTEAHGADPNVMYDFAYRIMDISEITPSHTLEGQLSKGYPKKLQPRDRSRAASVRQSQQIAAELNPVTLLEPNVRIDEGPPIIGPDGLVESGSGRVNALRLAMEQYPDGYAAYKQLLLDYVREGTYGDLDVAQIPDNPVLVRERLTEIDRFKFAEIANESAILGTSAAEQARIDTGKITDQMLGDLVISEGQTAQDALKSPANQGVVQRFVDQSPRSEHAMLMTSDGLITRQGMDRLLAAIFMYVYGSEDGGLRLAENVFESTDPVIKNITNGMMAAAGDMAKAEALIRSGSRPAELSVLRDLSQAVETLEGLKQRGIPLRDFIEQGTFEELGVGLSEFQTEILVDLEAGKRSAKAIRDQLQAFARLVIAEPDTGQMGLLGPHDYPTAQELWVRAKEAPASTAELFQLPEQYKMRGYFDQTPGIQENAAKSSEGLRNMLGILDEVREQMTGPESYLQEIRSDDVRGRLAPDQQAEFQKWTRDLKGQLAGTKFSGMKWGEETRNFSLLDYTALRGVDLNFLGPIANYSFWPTRTIVRWMSRFMEYPAMMANYARFNEARRKQEERPGFPRRLQGKIYMPLPWMEEWMGDGLWIDPIRQFFPPHMFLDNLDRVATAENRVNKRTEFILQRWVEDGTAPPIDAQEAVQTKTGSLWQMALDQANVEMEQEFKDPLDYMNLVTSLSLPLSIAHEIGRGTPERIQPVPLTRYTKSATSMFSQMTGIGNPEGVNLEGPIRDFFDLPRYDRFEDYRDERMLSSMAADNPEITREALIAGIEKEGPLHDEAIRRVNSARNFGIYANPAFWIFGLGGDTFPTGEVRQRKLSKEFGLAITSRELGDSTAINRFFEKYPEYETRLASFDSPEERMRFFLVDEVWVRYRALGSANKELARNQLGQDFFDLFLNKETRSYGDIPVEYLASWAHLLGGFVPENKDNRIEYKELAPPLEQLPPQFADIIDTFRDTRNTKFPNWFAVQQRYFASGPKKSQARKDYLAEVPMLENYWDWRDDQLEGNEFLKAYYRRYDLETRDAGSLGSLSVPEILTNPILMRQLMSDRYGGQSLTSGALAELRRIYELLQSPGGDFKEWVDGLEFEQGIEQPAGVGGLGTP